MALIQVDLPNAIDKKVELYQTFKDLKTKAEAVVQMLDSFKFDVKVKE